MASPPVASARLISKEEVRSARLFENIPQVDQLFEHIPFLSVEGAALEIPRIDIADPIPPAIDQRGVVYGSFTAADGTDFTVKTNAKLAYTPTVTRFYVKRLVGDDNVSSQTLEILSNLNNQLEKQADSKLQALRYQFCDSFVNGLAGGAPATEDDEEFAGINNITVNTGQVVSASGVNLAMALVDQLLAKVKSGNGRADFILMNFDAYLEYLSVIRALGLPPDFRVGELTSEVQLHHSTVPVFISNFIETRAGTPYNTDMYAGTIGENRGLVGIYEGPEESNGIRIATVGYAQDSDHITVRISWNCGIAAYEDSCVVKLDDFIVNTDLNPST